MTFALPFGSKPRRRAGATGATKTQNRGARATPRQCEALATILGGRGRSVVFAVSFLLLLGLLVVPPVSAQLGLARSHWFTRPAFEANVGSAVAAGDVNGDGIDDLVIGTPSREHDGLLEAGEVTIYLTSEDGPLTVTFDACGGLGAQFERRMGAAVAVGDFDGDGYDDIAVGLPGQEVGASSAAGAVCIIEGNASTFDAAGATTLDQSVLADAPEVGDGFGKALAAGDVDGDGYDDLAIGVPTEDIELVSGDYYDAGAVNFVFGGPAGLTAPGRFFFQGDGPVPGTPLPDEHFGAALAIGDVLVAGHADLIVGVPGDSPTPLAPTGGTVAIIAGADEGFSDVVFQPFYQGNPQNVLGAVGDGDGFGASLAVGDFDGDGKSDLAVGVPGESEYGPDEHGYVHVFYRFGGSTLDDLQQIFLESVIGGTVEAYDRFGTSLAAGDFNGDGRDDLAVGAPADNILGSEDAGEVTVLYGRSDGLAVAGHQVVNLFFFGALEAYDAFGSALVAGRFFDHTLGADLAIGVPKREVEGEAGAGGVLIIQSINLFSDGFESGDTSAWSAVVP